MDSSSRALSATSGCELVTFTPSGAPYGATKGQGLTNVRLAASCVARV